MSTANLLVVKTQAGEQKVALTNNVVVWGLAKASVSDVAKGAFIGVGATPQADGTQKAIRVIIFAEAMRGTGEGHRPWTRPNTTMTNATVDTTVSGVDGQNIMVKYKDGEKKIVIGPDAVIRQYRRRRQERAQARRPRRHQRDQAAGRLTANRPGQCRSG